LSAEEIGEFSDQLSAIIGYVEKIKELDTDSVAPAEHIAGLKNIFRGDTAEKSIPPDELAALAPDFQNGYIVVPKIIE